MKHLLVAGAGKIGAAIAHLLVSTGDYRVWLVDLSAQVLKHAQIPPHPNLKTRVFNVQDSEALSGFLEKNPIEAIISCLPYYCSVPVAMQAKRFDFHYFDLTEDTDNVDHIKKISEGSKKAFVAQCGLAPGYINIIANDMMQQFDSVEEVELRCGALGINSDNPLHYALTWSIDGLINEYGNPCDAIRNGQRTVLMPLENLEEIVIDDVLYEAFNTSGGLGSLAETFQGEVKKMSYKTLRHPGHCEKIRFLMQDLNLNEDRETLRKILQNILPMAKEDVVIVYVYVSGFRGKESAESVVSKKYFLREYLGMPLLGIQFTAACELCAVVDVVLSHPGRYQGAVRQEQFKLSDIHSNRFGKQLT